MEQDQDEEYVDTSSEVGKLIVRINGLEKRPSLDNSLGEILGLFMQSLKRSDDFLKSGIFKINFAEAALLLQSSALIYGKKVDLLWDMINKCQKRLISFKTEENAIELKKIEERERKYTRRRKPIENTQNTEAPSEKSKSFNIDWEDVNNFQHSRYEKDSKLYTEWHKKMICKWDSQPARRNNRSLADKQVQFRSLENAIFDKDQDNEFVVFTSKLESVIELEELMQSEKSNCCDFSFDLYSELYLIPKYLQENDLSCNDLLEHSVEVEKYIAQYRDEHFSDLSVNNNKSYDSLFVDKGTRQKLRRISVSSTVVSRLGSPDFDQIYMKKCQVNLLRLSVDDLSRLSRLSIDEMKKYCSEVEDIKSDNFQESFTYDKVDIPSALTDSSPHNKNDGVENCVSPTGKSFVTLNDKVHENAVKAKEKITRKKVEKSLKDCSTSEITFERVDYKTDSGATKIKRITERKRADDEMPEKRRKLSKAAIKKLATGITADLEEFNDFIVVHYKPEEGEGPVDQPEFPLGDPICSSSRIGLDEECPLSQLSDHPILCTQDSGYESNFQYHDDSISDNPPNSPGMAPADFPDPPPTPTVEEPPSTQERSTSEDCQSEEVPLHQKVYEWKQHMSEKFKTLKSADFNIHEYGSNIMENFEEGKPRKFSNIVKGKSAAEVTRFFISALQLANTHNVEIQGAQSGKLSNETFELKLITKERYYDRLKDYVAPSEQDYHVRLSKAKKMNKRREENYGEYSGGKRCKFN